MTNQLFDQIRDNTSRTAPRQPSMVKVVVFAVCWWSVILGAVWLIATLSHWAPK